ncbi:MAG: cytochrome b/b6 domain-containing protein [Firmicutes bacterium]|nr:cytochrome b/b6 domain-containing protein [Bacillota bacterium]
MGPKIVRHSPTVRVVHWAVALSTVALIFSGFGQMPMYKRYGVAQLPGLGWSGDFGTTLFIHYLAGMVLAVGVAYHLVFHGLRREFGLLPKRGDVRGSYVFIKAIFGLGPEPSADKFLPEQRLAYAFIGGNLLVVGITGLLKVAKNLPGVDFPSGLLLWATNLHTLSALLLVIGITAHLAAFAFRANRPLLESMFTGRVRLDYVRHRHPLWYRTLFAGSPRDAEDGSPCGGEVSWTGKCP